MKALDAPPAQLERWARECEALDPDEGDALAGAPIHPAIHPRRLRRLHRWYRTQLRERLDVTGDMSVTITGARWMGQRILDEGITEVLELGAGFSTLINARALRVTGGRLVAADHDPRWLAMMDELVALQGLDDVVHFVPIEQVWSDPPHAELIFVDHGPTWKARAASLPTVVDLARRSGAEVILDDWYPEGHRFWRRYCSLVIAELQALGIEPERILDSAVQGDRKHLARVSLG